MNNDRKQAPIEAAAQRTFDLIAEGARDEGRWSDLPSDDITRSYHLFAAQWHITFALDAVDLGATLWEHQADSDETGCFERCDCGAPLTSAAELTDHQAAMLRAALLEGSPT